MSIGFTLVPASAAASAVFVEQENVRRGAGAALQHKLLLIGQYNTGFTPAAGQPQQLLDLADAQARYGRGSLLARMAQKAFASGAVGYDVFALPLADEGAAVAASGDITPTGTATESGALELLIAGERLAVGVSSGDTAATVAGAIEAAVTARPDLPVTAAESTGTVTLTAKWGGTSGNQISIVVQSVPAGITITADSSLADGAVDPDPATALGELDATWYTEIACPYLGDTEISSVEAAGVARMDPLTKRPFIAFLGYTDTRANLLTALGDRNSEFSSFIPVHGSPTPAFEIGASFAGMWARHHAGDRVGRPVVGNVLPGVLAGSGNELTYGVRDSGVQNGASYTTNAGSSVLAGDTVTTRTETNQGVATTAYRFAVIIPNLQYKINGADITFGSPPFVQAVVITDDVAASPPFAVRPKTAVAYATKLVDDWVARGLTADREAVVDGIKAEIASSNPGRINVLIPDIPSAGLRILAAKIEWDFIV